MNEPSQKPSPNLASRRKLVRGVFSVPAVITLASGGPAAATSLACYTKPFVHPNVPTYPQNGQVPDGVNLVRIPYFKRINHNRFYFKGSDAHSKVFPGRAVLPVANVVASNGWQEVTISNGHCTAAGHTYSNPGLSSTPTGYLVVRYNEHGDIVGIGKGTTGTAIGGSCWVSVMAGH